MLRTVALTESAAGDVITASLLAQMDWGVGVTAMAQRPDRMELEVRAIVTEPPFAQTALAATEIAMGAQSALMGSAVGVVATVKRVVQMGLVASVVCNAELETDTRQKASGTVSVSLKLHTELNSPIVNCNGVATKVANHF